MLEEDEITIVSILEEIERIENMPAKYITVELYTILQTMKTLKDKQEIKKENKQC